MDYDRVTLEEFDDEICDFGDLKGWCDEHGCGYCDDVWDDYSMNENINERLVDWAREYSWDELYRILDEIPTGYDWYVCDEYDGTWSAADFDNYKSWCRDWGIENDEFYVHGDDDEDEEEYVDPYELEPTEEEDVSLDDMFSSNDVVMTAPVTQEEESENEDIFDILEWADEETETVYMEG